MTLDRYLNHRTRYEFCAVLFLALLIGLVNATTIIIERVRVGVPVHWADALGKELSATLVVLLLLPVLAKFLRFLDLDWKNVRWRVLWHIPGWIVFSLSHIALFVAVRKLLWALAGSHYSFGDLWLGLLYETRKGLLLYLAIVLTIHAYWFILDRLQGQADLIETQSDISLAYPEQFLIKMLNRQFLVKSGAIDWVQSASNYVLLHCAERSYPMRLTMTSASEQLDPGQFIRVHRTAIVNKDRVVALREGPDAQLELSTGALVPVSKTYLSSVKQALVLNRL